MILSDFTKHLQSLEQIAFRLPDHTLVPIHFHVTEVGLLNKHYIDCGGTVRKEQKIGLQLFEANDYNHRLHPEKLINIINLSVTKLDLPDVEIEVEYQGKTIEKYSLDFLNNEFVLTSTQTDCLAKEACGIPVEKPKVKLSDLNKSTCCTPGSGCC